MEDSDKRAKKHRRDDQKFASFRCVLRMLKIFLEPSDPSEHSVVLDPEFRGCSLAFVPEGCDSPKEGKSLRKKSTIRLITVGLG